MGRVAAADREGSSVMYLVCPGCDFAGDVWYKTCPPTYCSDACKQRAYRARKKAELVTNSQGESVTGLPKERIERAIDSTLHLLKCPGCGRSIWTVRGNVQIGGLACMNCRQYFREVRV